ncbi:hypothetical protein FHX78_113227 [Streptomyces capillispiralis]|uniref:Uncharacterized protein n=1 Tax=Streptomyces capillispiralis TaxID=68182 RepID=A0A561TGL1_9ACTN|nr:hypothetical protein FHX78_113227 [Streptomyces capillispiralis]
MRGRNRLCNTPPPGAGQETGGVAEYRRGGYFRLISAQAASYFAVQMSDTS